MKLHSFWYMSIIFLVVLPSCKKPQKPKKVLQKHVIEAKLYDVPLPLCPKSLEAYEFNQDGDMVVRYLCKSKLSQLVEWFTAEMLWHGWQVMHIVHTEHYFMGLYKTPRKICLVMLDQWESDEHVMLTCTLGLGQ